MSRVQRWRVLVSLASLRSSFDRWRLGFRRGRSTSERDAGGEAGSAGTDGGVPVGPLAEATVGAGAGAGVGAGAGLGTAAQGGDWYQGAPSGDRGTGSGTVGVDSGPTGHDAPTGESWWRDEEL